MKTMTPAQAEHPLTHVADRFTHWRQTRTPPAEPIPPYLWEHAIAFTTVCSISRVATRLRVSGGELNKRCAAHHATPSPPASPAALRFVEVPAPPVWPLPPTAMQIALHRPDGTRLRIAAQEPQLPLLAVVQAFLEAPSCCS